MAYVLKPQHIFDLVPLLQDACVSDDGEAFADHFRLVHVEVRAAIQACNGAYANAANQH